MGENCLEKIKFIALTSILLLLLIVIPTSFAYDKETEIAGINETIIFAADEDILGDDCYFDASIENDNGDGSIYNPYKKLTPYRIETNSINHLDSGEYDFNSNANFNNVTMIGASPADTIIRNAAIASSNSLNLYNLTFVDSTFKVQKDFNAVNCVFTNSSSTMYGGVITPVGDNVVKITLDGCTFSNNVAVCGGAIYIKEGVLNIKNSLFINNYAQLFGGAITSIKSSLTFDNITARNNKAEADGGAVYSLYGSFEMHNSDLINNTADNGAGIFVDEAEYDIIVNNRFIDNVALSRGSLYSFYNHNSTIRDNEYSRDDDLVETSELGFIGNGNYTLYNYGSIEITDIPSKYDLRDFGYITPVKNQGSDGNCWAFATMGVLESCILKALGESFDLSESNVKNLFGGYSDYGWSMETNKGGYASSGYNYLISWLGPVLESDDSYIVNTLFSKVFNSLMHIQNVLFLQRSNCSENDEIKKAIMTYGAVYSPIYASFDANGKQYYTGSSNANHAIVIVGWDDDLEFKGAPGKGGWIIKNSWGPNWKKNGYAYVSYYDVTCVPIGKVDSVFTFILNDTIRYDKNYQYDVQGKSDFFLNSSSVVWYKNKFVATEDEYLTAVSTMFDKNASYTLSIYVNGEFKLIQNGFTRPGYYTFNLDEIIPLKAGDVFEVVFNITVDGDSGVPIAEKVSYNKYYYKENTSFISYDGVNWADLYDLKWSYTTHTYNSAVACIKAFTILNPINTNIKLSIDDIGDTTLDLIATVYNEWGHAVNHGNVTFNVFGKRYTVGINGGVAKLLDVAFVGGINNFTATFNNVGYNNSTNYVLFNNDSINTTITFNEISQHNVVNVSAVVRDVNGNVLDYGNVTFSIEGKNYTVDIVNGIASINHTFTNFGLNNITAYYNGDYCYKRSNASKTVNISLYNTVISLNATNEYNPINLVVEVTDENGNNVTSGYVFFNIDGDYYPVKVSNGRAILNYTFTKLGVNNFSVTYADTNYIYNSSKTNKSITVSRINTKLEINVAENTNNPVEIVVLVKDWADNLVDIGEVTFYINGEIKVVKVNNSVATCTHIFTKTGNNTIFVEYSDDSYKYNSSNTSSSVNISKINIEMTVTIENNVDITIEFSEPINEYVHLLIDDTLYKQKTTNGKCTFAFNNLQSRFNRYTAFLDNYIYECDNWSGEFYFYYTSQITAENLTVHYGNSYSIVLTDVYTKSPIKNKPVEFIIDGQVYTNTTDRNGIAVINFDFVGKKVLNIKFDGDEDYAPCSSNVTLEFNSTIVSGYEVKTLNSQYEFKLFDRHGNALNNTEVNVLINSKSYRLVTDVNGNAQLNIDLAPGNYIIKITNPDTNEVKNQEIMISPRISENYGLTMYYGAGKSYNVKVFDDDGNIAKGVTVRFSLNGKIYLKTTDNNGYASIKISQNPGTYTIIAEYKDYKVTNKITVKTTIITKNIKVKKGKTIKFTAKLLNKNGKIIKNKKITFKFKGKKYKVKTNKKGKATLKITKKYKRGKYTVTTSYGKLKVKNTIRIK